MQTSSFLSQRRWVLGLIVVTAVTTVCAWDYDGHRIINQLALNTLPAGFPDFVKTPEARERIAFLGGEADRWRNSPDLAFKHARSPDHYFDFEELNLVGMDPRSLSPFRYEFAAQLALARAANRDRLPPIDPLKNADRTREWMGFLPWAMAEHQAQLKSAFSYLKAFEQHGGTRTEIANARENIIYVMGVMGHFVADGAQPLHTTKHHHGWVGDNPQGYSTNAAIHSWIDGGFIRRANIQADDLAPRLRTARLVVAMEGAGSPTNLFPVMVAWLLEQHRQVEPLYRLEGGGKLSVRDQTITAEGTAFIGSQLAEAAQMLGDLWLTAWQQAPEDEFLTTVLQKRNFPSPPSRTSGPAAVD
jgi:hypothetical protein